MEVPETRSELNSHEKQNPPQAVMDSTFPDNPACGCRDLLPCLVECSRAPSLPACERAHVY